MHRPHDLPSDVEHEIHARALAEMSRQPLELLAPTDPVVLPRVQGGAARGWLASVTSLERRTGRSGTSSGPSPSSTSRGCSTGGTSGSATEPAHLPRRLGSVADMTKTPSVRLGHERAWMAKTWESLAVVMTRFRANDAADRLA